MASSLIESLYNPDDRRLYIAIFNFLNNVSLRPHDEEINKARIVRTAMINFFIRVVFSLSGSKIDISTPEAVIGIIQSEISSDIVA